MNPIKAYMKEHGLDNKAMAELLSKKLDRNISEEGVRRFSSRKEAPKQWLNALGITPKEPSGQRATIPGRKPPETPQGEIQPLVSLPFEVTSAKATIELIYGMAGKAIGMASHTPKVGNLWEQSAPALADGWIEWAKESPTVANGIKLLTIGGPGGAVILTNASLIISTLMMVQQQRGIEIIPAQFIPPHERPEGDDQKIRENTDAAVDDALGHTQG